MYEFQNLTIVTIKTKNELVSEIFEMFKAIKTLKMQVNTSSHASAN